VSLLVALSFGLADRAEAQSQARARALFETGRIAVAEGDFHGAYRYFAEAYEITHLPRLLFNMASAADRTRDDERAVELYRQYLEELPEADNAAYVSSRIDILLSAAERRQPDPPASAAVEPVVVEPVAAAPDPVEEEPPVSVIEAPTAPAREAPLAAILSLVSGSAAAVAGAVMLGVAASERASVDNAARGSSWAEHQPSHDLANTLTPAGGVVAGVGVLAVVAGVALLSVTGDDEAASVEVGPTLGGLMLRGSF